MQIVLHLARGLLCAYKLA